MEILIWLVQHNTLSCLVSLLLFLALAHFLEERKRRGP